MKKIHQQKKVSIDAIHSCLEAVPVAFWPDPAAYGVDRSLFDGAKILVVANWQQPNPESCKVQALIVWLTAISSLYRVKNYLRIQDWLST